MSGDPAARLNYHHLHYFWAVATEGNLTRAARRLHVSQSALSVQIKQLEEQLGCALFKRERRTLSLTEAGRIALGYADQIFASGAELVATLRDGRRQEQVLRIGAVATLSRNFQESFVHPLLGRSDIRLELSSGSLQELLSRLESHALDLVLSNTSAPRDAEHGWRCRRVARQKASLVGRPRSTPFRFPEDLAIASMVLPSTNSDMRVAFDMLCEQLDVRLRIVAEVDDMAMLRLLARESGSVALVPSVVVRDELKSGRLEEYCVLPSVNENFYATVIKRRYQHPVLKALLRRSEAEILSMS